MNRHIDGAALDARITQGCKKDRRSDELVKVLEGLVDIVGRELDQTQSCVLRSVLEINVLEVMEMPSWFSLRNESVSVSFEGYPNVVFRHIVDKDPRPA